jgi:alpha-L-fucosidase
MKGESLFAIALAWPDSGRLTIKSLGKDAGLLLKDPAKVTLLGHPAQLPFRREQQALMVDLPQEKPCKHAYVLRIV